MEDREGTEVEDSERMLTLDSPDFHSYRFYTVNTYLPWDGITHSGVGLTLLHLFTIKKIPPQTHPQANLRETIP